VFHQQKKNTPINKSPIKSEKIYLKTIFLPNFCLPVFISCAKKAEENKKCLMMRMNLKWSIPIPCVWKKVQ